MHTKHQESHKKGRYVELLNEGKDKPAFSMKQQNSKNMDPEYFYNIYCLK